MRIPDRPSWPQAMTLALALAGASGIGGKQLASADGNLAFNNAAQARSDIRTSDNAVLVETIVKLQTSVERLNDTVQILSTKVAVIEDRQRRGK